MSISQKHQKLISFSVIFTAAFVFSAASWMRGVPLSADTNHHFQTANSLSQIFAAGNFLPTWSATENDGYGSVVLRLYPPLSYAVLAAAKFVAGNWLNAGFLAFLCWATIGGLGIYFWAREYFTNNCSLLAAIIYIFAPYRAVQLYSAFLYGEYAAAALLPFCFLFVARICRQPNQINVLGLAIFYALLILTHLPLTLIGSLGILFYFICCPKDESLTKTFGGFAGGIFLGLLAAGFQIARVWQEMNWVGISGAEYSAAGFYDYRQNFLFSFPYLNGLDGDIHQLWFLDLSLLATFGIALPALAIFYKKSDFDLKRRLRAPFYLFIFSLVMMTPLSLPIWNNLPLLQKLQFPWRWLTILTMAASISGAAGFFCALDFVKTRRRPLFLIVAGTLLCGLLFTPLHVIKQADYLTKEEFSVLVQNVGASPNLKEWLPIWATRETSRVREKIVSNRQSEILEWSEIRKTFKIEKGAPAAARIAIFYYPYWTATVNGESVSLTPATDGAISIQVPATDDAAIVELEFTEPLTIVLAFYVSLAVWLAAAIFILWNILSRSKT